MRRMPGSVYTLPVPAILSSQVLNTKIKEMFILDVRIIAEAAKK